MIIFIKSFVLAILAALAVLAVTNPMGFSVTQRVIGSIIICVLAGLAAYIAHRFQRKPKAPSPPAVSAMGGSVAAGRNIRNSKIATRSDGSKR